MLNSYQYSDSHDAFLKLMIQHARKKEMDRQIFEMLNRFFEQELNKENRAFSRPERARLFQETAKAILTDVVEKIDGVK